MAPEHVLRDLLSPGLKVVFCGTQAGTASAKRGAYYAGRGNKFWRTIHGLGLTPYCLDPQHYPQLLDFGIGLTDLAKKTAGPDTALKRDHFDVADFTRRMELFKPAIVAFNGKRAAAVALGVPTRHLAYGVSPMRICSSAVHVLPSTSGAAAGFWDVRYWEQLVTAVRELT